MTVEAQRAVTRRRAGRDTAERIALGDDRGADEIGGNRQPTTGRTITLVRDVIGVAIGALVRNEVAAAVVSIVRLMLLEHLPDQPADGMPDAAFTSVDLVVVDPRGCEGYHLE